jgi:hypothetical protein
MTRRPRSRSKKNLRIKKKLTFKTPGRECPHADRGACPRCMAGVATKAKLTEAVFAAL